VKPRDRELALRLEGALMSFDQEQRPLFGIRDSERRGAFLEQLLESIHRVELIRVLRTRRLSDRRENPNDELFDPLKAAILQQRQGNIEEAFWLVFLFVHFGKHLHAGWRYAREVYGRLGDGGRWDWAGISTDLTDFRAWLDARQTDLLRGSGPRGFGNHRKRESLSGSSANGTGAVAASYVRWVAPPRTHQDLMREVLQQAGGDPRMAFDKLYHSMEAVRRFGRLARFDYLTMVGKLGLAPIEPGSPYLEGSTGPLEGARLL
jgi:Alpha-glutamyl/putrescinyl thymine pyrophosphorylase clade 3